MSDTKESERTKEQEQREWTVEQEKARQRHIATCREPNCRTCAIINGTFKGKQSKRCDTCKQVWPGKPEVVGAVYDSELANTRSVLGELLDVIPMPVSDRGFKAVAAAKKILGRT